MIIDVGRIDGSSKIKRTSAKAAKKTLAGSLRKPKGYGHLRREEILRAAGDIFVTDGYERATIRKIAQAVGISATALYIHFKDKDAIFLELSKDGLRELEDVHLGLTRTVTDPVERARQMMRAYVAFGIKNPSLYWLLFCMSDHLLSPETQKAAAEMGLVCFEVFAETWNEAYAQGRLISGDATANMQAAWTACHGLTHMLIANPTFPWVKADILIDQVINGLLRGLTGA